MAVLRLHAQLDDEVAREYLTALESKFVTTWRRRSRSPVTTSGVASGAEI